MIAHGLSIVLCLLVAPWCVLGQDAPPYGVVIMVGDGFGPNQQALLDTWRRKFEKRHAHLFDLAENEATLGLLDTSPPNTSVVDSAAAGTAMACGEETWNGRIAVGPGKEPKPFETVLEAAKKRGWVTGLVTTSTITHATPACFAAHHRDRNKERQIALQLVEAHVDLLLGGGGTFFTKSEQKLADAIEPGMHDARAKRKYTDTFDLLDEARKLHGYTVVGTKKSMLAAPKGRLLGLFSAGHLPYEIDREELKTMKSVPRLAEMTRFALQRLSATGKPFFLMVEGGRIDHAAHKNDAGAMLHEILGFDDAIGVVKDHLRTHGRMALIVTSDHETGGFAIGKAKFQANQGVAKELAWLRHQKVSFEFVAARVKAAGVDFARPIKAWFGFDLTREEIAASRALVTKGTPAHHLFEPHRGATWQTAFGQVLARRTGIIWNTNGHTDAPIPVYAVGPFAKRFRGMHPQTLVGKVLLEHVRGVDVGKPKGD